MIFGPFVALHLNGRSLLPRRCDKCHAGLFRLHDAQVVFPMRDHNLVSLDLRHGISIATRFL